MKVKNKKLLKNRRRFLSRVAVGHFVIRTCGMCYGCRNGLPCVRPFVVWLPF